MRPSGTLLLLLGGWFALALLPLAARIAWPVEAGLASGLWWVAGVLLMSIALVDSLRRDSLRDIKLERKWPEGLPVGVRTSAELQIENSGTQVLRLAICEDAPTSVDVFALQPQLELRPAESVRLCYQLLPHRRGDVRFGPLWLRVASRWRLWEFCVRLGDEQAAKVYPDFAAISQFATLGIDARLNALGVHLQYRRGDGLDFRQLRSFREGDALRQIDWKATARYRKPISREYQEERDQDVIFVLDCGRRMRAFDGELSHFDLALNAVLLTGYVALHEGDAVGLLSFAGDQRWLAPLKGQGNVNHLISRLYDLHSTTATSDFVEAARQLLHRHRKRALVILVSDIRDEDADDLRMSCELLSSRHLVVVASLREACLDVPPAQPLHTFDDAVTAAGTMLYGSQRNNCLRRLRRRGIAVIDCPPKTLHIDMVAQYMAMKRSGAI